MSISRLGFEVDSSQAKGASVDLDKLTQSAERAEKAERGLSASSKQADTATGQLARSTRDTATATSHLERATDMVAAAQGRAVVTTSATTAALNAQAVATQRNAMMTRQLMYQLVDVGQTVPLLLMSPIHGLQNLGFQVAQIGQLYYGQGGMRAALRDMTSMVGRFASRLAPVGLAVGAVAAAIGGLTHEINEAGDVTVGFGDTALAVVQVVSGAIYSSLQPAIAKLSEWFGDEWGNIVREVKIAGNQIIGVFVGSYNFITSVWSNLGPAFTGFAKQAVNGLIEEFSNIPLLTIGDKVLWEGPDLSGYKRSLTAEEQSAVSGATGSFGDAMSRDYMGEFFGAVSARATQNALEGIEESADKAGKSLKGAADKAKAAWEKMQEAIQNAKQSLGEGFGNILKGLIDKSLSWRDALIQAGQALLKYLNQMNIAQGGSGLFGGGFIQGLLGGLLGFRNGAAFAGGNVTAFANGGIVSRPTLFPMANGAGLMGEAGPEAVMPLRRGRDGRLGVEAANSSQTVTVDVRAYVDDDGNWQAEVERVSRPVAQEAAAQATSKMARAVPGMVDARTDERQTRRIRPRGFAA